MRGPLLNMRFRFGGDNDDNNKNANNDKEDIGEPGGMLLVSSSDGINDEEPAILGGTPLAEYLSDTGISDWGIEKDGGFSGIGDDDARLLADGEPVNMHEDELYDVAAAGPRNISANIYDAYDPKFTTGTTRKVMSSKTVFPLVLAQDNSKGSGPSLRKRRFRDIFHNALNPALSSIENAQFLDRFHYIFITSSLLDVSPRLNLSTSSARYDLITSKRRKNILFGRSGPWDVKMNPKYWAGAGGGYVVLIAVLLSWRVKSMNQYSIANTSGVAASVSATTTLVVLLTVGLYLFAHSRRKLMRMLRAKALAYAGHAAVDNESFDKAIGRAIGMIREIELISLGYQPSNNIPAVRLDYNVAPHDRAAKQIRAAVCAALYLAQTEYISAIDLCVKGCNYLDLQRYFDVYEISKKEAEFSAEINKCTGGVTVSGTNILAQEDLYGSGGCNASLAKIKREFRRLQFLRRTFVCCLLSVSTSGNCQRVELDIWSNIVDSLETISGLLTRLSNAISRDQLFKVHETEDIADPEQSAESKHVAELATLLQHVQARLYRMNEESSEYWQSYELLGQDLKNVLDAWQRGRTTTNNNENNNNNSDNTSASSVSPASMTSDVPFRRHMPSMSTSTIASTLVDFDEDIYRKEPIVLEGIVEDEEIRESRIEKMKQARRAEQLAREVAKENAKQQRSFVLELGSVLGRRKMGTYTSSRAPTNHVY